MINIKTETPPSLLNRIMAMWVLRDDATPEQIQDINPKFVMEVDESEVDENGETVVRSLIVVDWEFALFESENYELKKLIETIYDSYIVPRLQAENKADPDGIPTSDTKPGLTTEQRAAKIGLNIVR